MAPPAAIETLAVSDTTVYSIPDRLTIQSVVKRRAASGKLNAGIAATADVHAFKGRTHHLHKAKARRWDRKFMTPSYAGG
nr:hypothetical protein CFP56_66138 [Quercus suber]